MRGKTRLFAALALMLGAAAAAPVALAPPALAQAIVVRSTGPSAATYPKGKQLAAGAKVLLKAGDVVTVLDKVGSRVLRGAGSFAMDSRVLRDRGIIPLLSRSLKSPQAIRAGAVRGGAPTGGAAQSPLPSSIWLADIDKGGKVCVPTGSDLYLWRSTNGERRFTWLGEADGGGTVRLFWPPRTSAIAWPIATMTLIAGRNYRSNDDGVADKWVDLQVVPLAPEAIPQDADALATLLFENGCGVQFELLANALERTSDDAVGGN